ncbi:hypothetical protein GWI33_004435 [Rhynchophorus ferrugineus]|uniref:Uncharacterized protein n=1 Tax=Rhynchophorus ferrugineus TaxID=354439 RepID=A0A834IIX7_RHYFE|nr:hypothetical protein GWI33_004435 [Rhynchophorus ferrugineus]
MYDTIHKQKPHKDEFVTIKYRQKRAQYPYTSGYLSEPEPGAYDSDFTEYKYATLDRRRPPEAHHHQSSATMPRSHPDKSYSSSDIVRNTQETYRVQPGRIENYVPGHSSISESEAKKWWDEVMGIFDGWLDENSALPSYEVMFTTAMNKSHLEQQNRVPSHKPRSFINQALKESGYESDSTLIFKRKEDNANRLNPREQREAYKVIQKGGDVPFQGLRKPAPERPKETDLVEFYPLSPTLTKIRIHKSVIPPQECYVPQKEFLCYPVTIQHDVPKTFANFKRTVPSMATSAAASVPSPPKRRSSRNNTTLRLISTMKVQKSPTGKRHETCFTTGPSVERTKVNYLKDKITCKLSPVNKKRGDAAKMSVVKKVTASPELKSKITSTLTTSKDPKSSVRRVQSSTKISTEKTRTGTFGGIYKSGSTGSITSKKSSTENLHSRTPTPVKTFGVEKKKFDLKLTKVPDVKASSSQGLLSPTEVKKGMRNISNPNAQYRKSLALLSSSKINNTNAALPIKVGITEKGKNLLKSSVKRPQSVSPKSTRKITPSPCPSTSSERSKLKSSTESLSSSKSSKKIDKNASKLKNKPEKKTTTKPSCKKSAELSKCLSKATGADIAKKLDRDGASEIVKQKEAIESNHFFRNLLLRGVKQSASFTIPKNSWIVERTNQLQRRRSVSSEPSIGAMKIYLKHTKPVTDSKFVSLDVPRSRSASPKSVTFCEPPSRSSTSKRSKSLPTKIVFTETSRPVSPVIPKKKILPILKSSSKDDINVMARAPSPQAKVVLTETSRPITPPVTRRRRSPISISKSTSEYYKRTPSPQTKLYFSETSRPVSPEISRKTPTHSPVLPRAPSCRKIMQLKQMAEPSRPEELSLYSCADLKHSTTSLDSFRSDDYQIYLKDIGFHSPKSEKFKDLNHFYSDIEKVGQLEQKCSLKPRKKAEEEIIDYDRWMEVRSRERAEHELKCLYNHLKSHEREKGFLFLPKDVERFRWKRELDRGLRIKEKSVENIKEEFERIKKDESDLENARRREIAYSKDTYKPLWRGNSVINLASILSERRSQSESRVKSSKKLLDDERGPSHGIGSRIWSSLSMEQVNNLKRQLQDIYGHESTEKTDSKLKDYTVDVPKDFDKKYIPSLTIRRNSESSKPDAMNEDEKKMISQLLSKEALEKIVKRRKEDKLALPVMVGKEVLGAIATQEAIAKKPFKMEEPPKPLVKTNALSIGKQSSISEAESASTDESTRTVINLMDVQKKVEYFEKAKDLDTYVPTVYQPAEDGSSQSEGSSSPTHHLGSEITSSEKQEQVKHAPSHSKSYQDLKEYFGESELVKFATLPLSATKKSSCTYTKKPQLRALDISPIRTISEANSLDSLCRSRSVSPYYDEMKSLTKKGEVKKLKKQFELFEDFFGEKKLQRSRSENDLRTYGHVEDLKRKYEYPVHSGRGRSRTKRGGVVSPVWLRPEDRYMPHINIISKIASLYSFSKQKSHKDASRSMEELAEILGCPIGEVSHIQIAPCT